VPDHNSLKIGDQIRLLCVPAADLEQREQELRDGTEMAGSTADAIERIITSNPVVMITKVDEFGCPWFDVELTANDGATEYHSLTVTDDESWEFERH
jgi:hypothetical protein